MTTANLAELEWRLVSEFWSTDYAVYDYFSLHHVVFIYGKVPNEYGLKAYSNIRIA